MKTVKLTTILTVVGLSFLFAACSETESIDESMDFAEKSAQVQALQVDSCTYDGVLTEAEIEGLEFMREEEKLARDVYLYFFEIWGESIFQNIAKSEDAHMAVVLNLIEGYGLNDPASEVVGEFNNEQLAKLYAELTAEGKKGLVEALTVGAIIEDLDIADLKELLAKTENEDVKHVFENLLAGSENHMRAFVGMLETLGGSYSAQFISADELEDILAAENSNGNGGQSKGNAQGNSNGNKGNNDSGSNECDDTQTGSTNGSQTGSANGTQTGSSSGNQNGSQSGSTNSNSTGNTSGNSNGNSNGNSGSQGKGK